MAQGAEIFTEHCASCHGATGQGDGLLVQTGQLADPPPDFTHPATAQGQTPAEWFATITNGRIEQFMPPWRERLTEQARWSVALYTYTMSYSRDQMAVGQSVWDTHCAECHIEQPIAADSLNAQSDRALLDFITQSDSMHAFGDMLNEVERHAVTAYARTLTLDNADLIGQSVPSPVTTEDVLASDVVADIGGRVTNGTAGGSVPSGLPLTLHIFDRQFNDDTFDTTLDDAGAFTFADVPIRADRLYAVTVSYQNRVFSSELVAGDSLTSTPNFPVTIYELTDDPDVMTITDFDLQIIAAPDRLQVAQIVTLRNGSDRMFSQTVQVDDSRYASITVPLPAGAEILDAAGDTQRYVLAADSSALLDTRPVLPNKDHVIHIIYALPYDGAADIRVPLNYMLDGAVQLLIEPDSLHLTSEQLTAREPQTLDGAVFQSYGATLTLPGSDALRLSISGATIAPTQSAPPPNLLAFVLIAFGSLALLVAAIVYARGRRTNQALNDLIIEQIATLDQLHTAGKIETGAYHEQRTRLKKKLAKLLRR